MDAIKDSHEGPISYGILSAIGMTPPQVEDRLIGFFTEKASAVVTNVPGPRETVYLAGTPVRGVLVWAPCSGTIGMTVSIFSYAGEVTVGFMVDTALLPDPQPLVRGLRCRAAGAVPRHPPAGPCAGLTSSGIERVEDVGELAVDDGPLDLHRRGQLAVLLGEVAVEDGEALDLLDASEALVHMLDLPRQLGVHALVLAIDGRVAGRRRAARRAPAPRPGRASAAPRGRAGCRRTRPPVRPSGSRAARTRGWRR